LITTINNQLEFHEILSNNKAVLVYFSNDACNVCKVLKPKVEEMLDANFPEIQMYYVDTVLTPDISAQYTVFTIPTIVVFFEGKEIIRKSRHIGVDQLQSEIERPYSIFFS